MIPFHKETKRWRANACQRFVFCDIIYVIMSGRGKEEDL